MTRTEAIATITAKLAALDDERVLAVAEIVDEIAADTGTFRSLTESERALLEQSKADFVAGRTCTADEYRAEMTSFMADLKTKHP